MEALRGHFPGEIVERPLTWRGIRESFRTCHLFDFEKSAWVTFRSLAAKDAQ